MIQANQHFRIKIDYLIFLNHYYLKAPTKFNKPCKVALRVKVDGTTKVMTRAQEEKYGSKQRHKGKMETKFLGHTELKSLV